MAITVGKQEQTTQPLRGDLRTSAGEIVGRAQSQFGEALGKVGETVVDVELATQKRQEEIAERDARAMAARRYTDWSQKDAATTGALESTTGNETFEYATEVDPEFSGDITKFYLLRDEENYREITEGMDERTKRYFDQLYESGKRSSTKNIIRHQARESEKFYQDSMKDAAKIHGEQAKSATDEESRTEHVNNGLLFIDAAMAGQSEATRKVVKDAFQTDVYAQTAISMKTEDPERALEYWKGLEDKEWMGEEVYNKVLNDLQAADDKGKNRRDAAGIYKTNKTLSQMQNEVNAADIPDRRKTEVMNEIKGMKANDEATRAEANRQRNERVAEIASEPGMTYRELQSRMGADWINVELPTKAAAEAFIDNAREPVMNWEHYTQVMTLDYKELAQRDIFTNDRHMLDDRHYDELVRLRSYADDVLSGRKGRQPKEVNYRTAYSQANAILDSMKISRKSEEGQRKREQVHQWIQDQIDIQEADGRELTNDETTAIVRMATIEVSYDTPWFSGGADREEPLAVALQDPASLEFGEIELDSIPTAQQNATRQWLINNGFANTDDNVEIFYYSKIMGKALGKDAEAAIQLRLEESAGDEIETRLDEAGGGF